MNILIKILNSKGITLIALILTVIILLILAAVTLSFINGDRGILSRTEIAATETEKAKAKEEVELAAGALNIEVHIKEMTQEEKRAFLEVEIQKYESNSTVEISGEGFKVLHRGYEFYLDLNGKITSMAKQFNSAEWDATSATEDCFYWQSDDPNDEGYGTIIGFRKNVDNYPKLRIPSRCTKLEINLLSNIIKQKILKETGEVLDERGDVYETYRSFVSNIYEVELPETVTYISKGCFSYNYSWNNLEKINIPSKVTTIEEKTFYGCKSLEYVSMSDNITTIKKEAFSFCENLEKIILSKSLKSIDSRVFYGCKSLIAITIPNSAVSIENDTFSYCNLLKTIKVKKTENSISGAKWGANSDTVVIWDYSGDDVEKEENVNFDAEEWDKKAAPEDIFIWETDYKESDRYGTLIGFRKNVDNYPKLRIPSRCTNIKLSANSTQQYIENQPIDSIRSFTANIKEIQLPETIKTIGCGSFYNGITNYYWNNLEKINIPNGVISIEDSAFAQCKKLKNITIPSSVIKIGYSVFYNCDNLSIIRIKKPENSISGAKWGANNDTKIIWDYVDYIPENIDTTEWDKKAAQDDCFIWESDDPDSEGYGVLVGFNKNTDNYPKLRIPSRCTEIAINLYKVKVNFEESPEAVRAFTSNVKEIEIPETVTNIASGSFCIRKDSHAYYWDSLEKINIPGSVTVIGIRAFGNCTNLKYITIKEGVNVIDQGSFYNCTSLENITIPNSVTSIGDEAFCDCTNLKSITISSSITSIGRYAFYRCTALTNITIPSGVTSIGDGAFNGCTALKSIAIPSSVTSIGNSAFSRCTSLTNITIPSSVTSIGNNAFYGCKALTNITIPSSVTSIGTFAFDGCTSLTNITIPSSVTSIGSSAFSGCTSLTNINIMRPENSISGANWGAPNATVNWNYTGE